VDVCWLECVFISFARVDVLTRVSGCELTYLHCIAYWWTHFLMVSRGTHASSISLITLGSETLRINLAVEVCVVTSRSSYRLEVIRSMTTFGWTTVGMRDTGLFVTGAVPV
jgi:hypothetical protein